MRNIRPIVWLKAVRRDFEDFRTGPESGCLMR
jgi:hypothetical protein